MIGPKHYEGWTCKGCDYLETKEYSDYEIVNRCISQDIKDEAFKKNPFPDVCHTPHWCPYKIQAIVRKNCEIH